MFNNDSVLTAAYADLTRNKKARPSSSDLHGRADHYHTLARDALITQWAEEIESRWGRRLINIYDLMLDRVEKTDTTYWIDLLMSSEFDDTDDDEVVSTVAWGMAILRWYRLIDNGRATFAFEMTTDDVQAWLDAHDMPVHSNPAQVSLFTGI